VPAHDKATNPNRVYFLLFILVYFLKRVLKVRLFIFCGFPSGLEHLIMLRSGDAFFDEPLTIASAFFILIFAGSRRYSASRRAGHRIPTFGFRC